MENEELKEELLKNASCLYSYIANNFYKFTEEQKRELLLNALYVANDDKQVINETIERL